MGRKALKKARFRRERARPSSSDMSEDWIHATKKWEATFEQISSGNISQWVLPASVTSIADTDNPRFFSKQTRFCFEPAKSASAREIECSH